MSDVEKLYLQLQGKTLGDIPFRELPIQEQVQFTQAVNYILYITSLKK